MIIVECVPLDDCGNLLECMQRKTPRKQTSQRQKTADSKPRKLRIPEAIGPHNLS